MNQVGILLKELCRLHGVQEPSDLTRLTIPVAVTTRIQVCSSSFVLSSSLSDQSTYEFFPIFQEQDQEMEEDEEEDDDDADEDLHLEMEEIDTNSKNKVSTMAKYSKVIALGD